MAYRRFQDCSVSEKMLNTMFLVTIGLGYLFALAHMYFSHEGRDGQAGLSIQDIQIAYYGKSEQTRLGAALNGSMSSNLESSAQKDMIFKWIENGTEAETFNSHIAPIFNNNCIMCHSVGSGMNIAPLTTYEEVLQLTQHDTGISIESLVRVSHIHMFGIAFILFFVGRIFILCDMPVNVKRTLVAIPFIAILIDIISWYITKVIPGFSYVVVASGALMGISLGGQITVSIYQMWWCPPKLKKTVSK